MYIILFLIMIIAIIWLEVPRLVQQKKWRDLAVFGMFWFTGSALGMVQLMGIEIPNPHNLLIKVFKPLTEVMGLK